MTEYYNYLPDILFTGALAALYNKHVRKHAYCDQCINFAKRDGTAGTKTGGNLL